jgi:hypothetical protein
LIFWSFFIKEKGQYSTILCRKNDYFIKKEQKLRYFDVVALGATPTPFDAHIGLKPR